MKRCIEINFFPQMLQCIICAYVRSIFVIHLGETSKMMIKCLKRFKTWSNDFENHHLLRRGLFLRSLRAGLSAAFLFTFLGLFLGVAIFLFLVCDDWGSLGSLPENS